MADDLLQILQGNCLEVLPSLPDESVHCCVTSPPYWGLRDYGTAQWEGGDANCEHRVRENSRIDSSTLGGGKDSSGHQQEGFKDSCPRCGAKRIDMQLGLEATPWDYAAKMVQVFREVKRVLCDDGTLWLNLGDSYAGGGNNRGNSSPLSDKQSSNGGATGQVGVRPVPSGLKAKDLVGIPWMVAFALREDGWYLRSDIIWAKPNPMPESVLDRPTRAHEFMFLLAKSAQYYYDADAVREPYAEDSVDRYDYAMMGCAPGANQIGGDVSRREREKRIRPPNPLGRNRRDVWTISGEPFRDAHFATFPPDLIKPCILAGCPVGGTVLDPFAGSGTTGMVAIELGRKAVLIELNPAYCKLIEQRTAITPGLPLP